MGQFDAGEEWVESEEIVDSLEVNSNFMKKLLSSILEKVLNKYLRKEFGDTNIKITLLDAKLERNDIYKHTTATISARAELSDDDIKTVLKKLWKT